MRGEPCGGSTPERGGGGGLFVVEDLGVDDAGAVIERGVDVAVAGRGPDEVAVVAGAADPPAATGRGSRRSSSRRRG